MEEFYQPQSAQGRPANPGTELERVGELDEEPSNDNNISNDQPANEKVEVLNFEELVSEEEEDDGRQYTGEEARQTLGALALNEIAEDAYNEDQHSPVHPSRHKLNSQDFK